MPKTNYDDVLTQVYRLGHTMKIAVKCFYRNNSLAVIGEYTKWDNDNDVPLFSNRYRIIILGDRDSQYSGLALDYIYPKTQKAARQLADELDSPNWAIFDKLTDEQKSELIQKIKKAAGM